MPLLRRKRIPDHRGVVVPFHLPSPVRRLGVVHIGIVVLWLASSTVMHRLGLISGGVYWVTHILLYSAMLCGLAVGADSDPRRNVFIRLHRRQCGACGYNLGDLRPEPDRCTLCPECGAAWKLPATGRPQ